MATPIQKNLIQKNHEYVAQFTQGDLALPPAKNYLVGQCLKNPNQTKRMKLIRTVTCMDARIDPVAAYGISLGDAHVIRNAGGSARDALRSIVISQQLIGTKEVLVIKHSGCGMLTFKNEDAYKVVEGNLGKAGAEALGGLDFLAFTDVDDAVRDDVKYLQDSKAVADDVTITGWVYEVETGKVRAVE